MTPNAKKQAAYRARQTAKLAELLAASLRLEKREQALRDIADRLEGNTKTLAMVIRAKALEGLE